MRALVLGGSGLLGHALLPCLAAANVETFAPSHAELDVLDTAALRGCVRRLRPDVVFNLIAYTAVDKAEEDGEAAMRLNAELPVTLGVLARETDAFLMHYSTDYVFDGTKGGPYAPEDRPHPLCVYGASKRAGEEGLLELGAGKWCVARTAWIFGPGKKNFIETILGLAATREEIRVVNDQTGSPTYTVDLARATLELALRRQSGIVHAVNAGQATWCDLAAEAVRLAGRPCRVRPISSAEYPQKARRPAFSVLDASLKMPDWKDALARYMAAR